MRNDKKIKNTIPTRHVRVILYGYTALYVYEETVLLYVY